MEYIRFSGIGKYILYRYCKISMTVWTFYGRSRYVYWMEDPAWNLYRYCKVRMAILRIYVCDRYGYFLSRYVALTGVRYFYAILPGNWFGHDIFLDTVFSERILLWSMDLRGGMNLCILWIRVCFPYIGGFQYSCHGICWCTRSLCNYGVYDLWNMCIEMKGKFYIMKILCEAGLLNFAFLQVSWLACFGVYKRTFMKFGFFVQSEITSWLVKRLWRICLSLCFFVCEIKFHNCECCVQIVMYFWNGMIVESTEEWICVVFRAE